MRSPAGARLLQMLTAVLAAGCSGVSAASSGTRDAITIGSSYHSGELMPASIGLMEAL